jgi:peptidoglycan/LPS O-acetylase OafA/YrhL
MAELKSLRNPGIDALRGICIVLVVLHHVGMRIDLRVGLLAEFLPRWVLGALIYSGYEAVFVFFVISGFLITSNALSRWGSLGEIALRPFYIQRAARILPCLLLLLAVLSLLHLLGLKDYVISRPEQSLAGALFSALALHLNWYEGSTGYLPGNWDVLWSLSIEESFYLGFPLLCIALRKTRLLVPALIVLALSLPLTRGMLADNSIWQEKAYLPGMAAIATGVLAAIWAPRLQNCAPHIQPLAFAFGGVSLIAVLFFSSNLWANLGEALMLVLTIGAAALVLSCHWRALAKPTWSAPLCQVLQSFGRYSYEIYLTHMFVVWPIVDAFKAYGSNPRSVELWHFLALALTWLLGAAVARYFSIPAQRLVKIRFEGLLKAAA